MTFVKWQLYIKFMKETVEVDVLDMLPDELGVDARGESPDCFQRKLSIDHVNPRLIYN